MRTALTNLQISDPGLTALTVMAIGIGVFSLLKPTFLQDLLSQLGLGAIGKVSRFLRGGWQRRVPGVWIGRIFIPDEARLRHTHVLGASGGGKTAFIENLIYRDLERGHGALIIDPKGDRELYERVQKFCHRIGRDQDLNLLSARFPDESVRWNPCGLGTASELQTKWFNSGEYGEPFYAKACELGLLQACNGLVADRNSFALGDLVTQLEVLAERKKNAHMEGLFLELKNFAEGEWGEVLCVSKESGIVDVRPVVSLRTMTRKNEILFVDLPTEGNTVQSSRLGKLLLMEMMLLSGIRKGAPEERGTRPFSVYVDEFDAFATERFATFLNKGRSSDFMIHIAHQSLGDLEKVGPGFQKIVMNNCNVRAVFTMHDPDDADYLARFAGTRQVLKKTFRTDHGLSTGQSSNRETEEFVVHPNRIKQLRIGECLLSIKTERFLRVVRLPMPDPKPKRRMVTERLTPLRTEKGIFGRTDLDVDQMAYRKRMSRKRLVDSEKTGREGIK